MSSWCTQGQLYLLPLCWRYDFNVYVDVFLIRAVCSHGTVCHCTVLCCVKTHTVVIWWSVSNMEFWQHLCMCLFFLCNAHPLCLSLSFPFALLLSHLLFGLVIWKIPHCVFKIFECVTCFDPYWPWHLASPKMGTCLCFLQELQFRILPCTVDHILFTDEKKDQTQLKLSQKLFVCQKCIISFCLYRHHLVLIPKFIFNSFLSAC